jgi:hypothetical protein
MTLAQFKDCLSEPKPPEGLGPALAALWWAGKDEWDKAHAIVMDEGGEDCSWVHAHLHRVEGDLDNARYWYRQARRPAASGPAADEWDAIVTALLARRRA